MKCRYDESPAFVEEAFGVIFEASNNERIDKYVTEFTKIKEDNDLEEGTFYNHQYSHLFKSFEPPSDSLTPKAFLIFGDEKGFLKHWDISAFLTLGPHEPTHTPPRVGPVSSMKDKLSYNAKRK